MAGLVSAIFVSALLQIPIWFNICFSKAGKNPAGFCLEHCGKTTVLVKTNFLKP